MREFVIGYNAQDAVREYAVGKDAVREYAEGVTFHSPGSRGTSAPWVNAKTTHRYAEGVTQLRRRRLPSDETKVACRKRVSHLTPSPPSKLGERGASCL